MSWHGKQSKGAARWHRVRKHNEAQARQERANVVAQLDRLCTNPECPHAGNCHGECVKEF